MIMNKECIVTQRRPAAAVMAMAELEASRTCLSTLVLDSKWHLQSKSTTNQFDLLFQLATALGMPTAGAVAAAIFALMAEAKIEAFGIDSNSANYHIAMTHSGLPKKIRALLLLNELAESRAPLSPKGGVNLTFA
jgi:hypothetical protein